MSKTNDRNIIEDQIRTAIQKISIVLSRNHQNKKNLQRLRDRLYCDLSSLEISASTPVRPFSLSCAIELGF